MRRLRAALPLVDPGAASPKETWLRLLLIDAGLPIPTTQIPVQENWRLVGVVDMGWQKYMVAVEYDGDHHRANRHQYARDQDRQRQLEELSWCLLARVSQDSPRTWCDACAARSSVGMPRHLTSGDDTPFIIAVV